MAGICCGGKVWDGVLMEGCRSEGEGLEERGSGRHLADIQLLSGTLTASDED